MSNVTLETSNFGEQLGAYDFFNVLVSGSVFLSSLAGILLCINDNLKTLPDISILEGVIISVAVFFVGLIIQELGSIADRCIWHVKEYNYRNFLKKSCPDKRIMRMKRTWKYVDKIAYRQAQKSNKGNCVIHNPALLCYYREIAKGIIDSHPVIKKKSEYSDPLEDDNVNRCIFSYCEYFVSCQGKDKKVEKLRALFAMARSFATCSFLVEVCSLIAIIYKCLSDNLNPLSIYTNPDLQKLSAVCIVCLVSYQLFRSRMTKMMRYMILILMGNYNACIISQEFERKGS